MWCKFKGNTENVPYNVPYAQSVGWYWVYYALSFVI